MVSVADTPKGLIDWINIASNTFKCVPYPWSEDIWAFCNFERMTALYETHEQEAPK